MCFAQILFCVGQKKGFPGREKRVDKKGLLKGLFLLNSGLKIGKNHQKSKQKPH
jgi:hypothetical protein